MRCDAMCFVLRTEWLLNMRELQSVVMCCNSCKVSQMGLWDEVSFLFQMGWQRKNLQPHSERKKHPYKPQFWSSPSAHEYYQPNMITQQEAEGDR